MNYISIFKKSISKIISYRVITSIISFLVLLLITRSLSISIIFILSEILFKPFIFVWNELFWEKTKETKTSIIQELSKPNETISETTIKRLVYSKRND